MRLAKNSLVLMQKIVHIIFHENCITHTLRSPSRILVLAEMFGDQRLLIEKRYMNAVTKNGDGCCITSSSSQLVN